MATIRWNSAIDGAFGRARNWKGKAVPGAGDAAVLNAAGSDYTVTSSTAETVDSIQLAANATLRITASTFTATAGTGSGANAGTIAVFGAAKLFIGGAVDNTGVISLNNPASGGTTTTNLIIASNTALSGGGSIALSDSFFNRIIGNGVSLTNVDNVISGAGIIGGDSAGLALVNEAGGIIDANGAGHLLEIEPPSGKSANGSVTNDGLLEGTGGGELVLAVGVIDGSGGQIVADSGSSVLIAASSMTGQSLNTQSGGTIDVEVTTATVSSLATNAGVFTISGGALTLNDGLDNSGQLILYGGSATVAAPVTGEGFVALYAGTLEAKSIFNENVIFTDTEQYKGLRSLVLGQSQSYSGQLTDFSYGIRVHHVTPDKSTLDLRDIGFAGAGEATFSGTSTSGVLTVTDGTHTAHIDLVGDYRSATFTASSDTQGGTDVVVSAVAASASPSPPQRAAALSSAQRFVHALASLAGPAAAPQPSSGSHDAGRLLLATPRMASA